MFQKLASNIFRLILTSDEAGVFYLVKGRLYWDIKKDGQLLGQAKSKAEAVELCKSFVGA
jgi:predicted Rdx family selenoprotein